jgi:hypothetical protein
VRAALVEQEERIAQRRRTLDRFLAEARPDPVEKTAQRQQRDPGMGREERVNP